jgi:hypothetical protein
MPSPKGRAGTGGLAAHRSLELATEHCFDDHVDGVGPSFLDLRCAFFPEDRSRRLEAERELEEELVKRPTVAGENAACNQSATTPKAAHAAVADDRGRSVGKAPRYLDTRPARSRRLDRFEQSVQFDRVVEARRSLSALSKVDRHARVDAPDVSRDDILSGNALSIGLGDIEHAEMPARPRARPPA